MRWVVELPAPSGGTAASVTVDADSWAGALTHARGGSPVQKFRCEFDADNVVRVLDLATREWYTIKPLVAQASEPPQPVEVTAPAATASADLSAPVSPFALAADANPEDFAPQSPPPTAELSGSVSDSASVDSDPAPNLQPGEVAPSASDEPGREHPNDSVSSAGVITPELLFERDQDPSETNPLTYRERVFAVAPGTSVDDAEAVARHALSALRRALATRPRGRYVVIAVFDHHFSQKPLRGPLVEARWKDWRGEPELTRPGVSATSMNGSAHEVASEITASPQSAAPADVSGSVDASAALIQASSAPDLAVEAASAPTSESSALAAEAAPSSVVVSNAIEAPTQPELSNEANAAAIETEQPSPIVAKTTVLSVVEPTSDLEPQTSSLPGAEVAAKESALAEPTPPVPVTGAATEIQTAPELRPETERGEGESLDGASAASTALEAAPKSATADEPAVVVSAAAGAPERPAASSAEAAASDLPSIVAEAPPAPTIVATPEPVGGAASGRAARTIPKRLRGKDLLSELFDSLMDLSHMESVEAASRFIARLMHDHVQCDVVGVSTYDIDKDEFVVAAALGAENVVGRRVPAGRGAAGQVVRRKTGLIVASCGPDDVSADDLLEGGCALSPALYRERLFGLLRLHRVPGAESFENDELDAVSYVAGQFGEFLSTQSTKAAAVEFAPEPRRSVAPPRRSIPPTKG